MKRFKFSTHSGGSKISENVEFPMEALDLRCHMREGFPTDESTLYDLTGLVQHAGNVSGGHYTSYSCRDGNWYEFNDSSVREVNSKSVASAEGYILFYTKQPSAKTESILQSTQVYSSPIPAQVGVDRLWWEQVLTNVEPPPPDHCISARCSPRSQAIAMRAPPAANGWCASRTSTSLAPGLGPNARS